MNSIGVKKPDNQFENFTVNVKDQICVEETKTIQQSCNIGEN